MVECRHDWFDAVPYTAEDGRQLVRQVCRRCKETRDRPARPTPPRQE